MIELDQYEQLGDGDQCNGLQKQSNNVWIGNALVYLS